MAPKDGSDLLRVVQIDARSGVDLLNNTINEAADALEALLAESSWQKTQITLLSRLSTDV
jgi:hypothetical protein